MAEKSDPAASEDASQQRINAAKAEGIPQIYLNGFATAFTVGDVLLAVERNGQPVAMLNMSFTVAKTLAVSLGQAVGRFEEATGREMLTTQEVERALGQPNVFSAAKEGK